MSPATKLALKALGNCVLVYVMNLWLPQYFSVYGGAAGFVIIGSLLTLLNLFLRPILSVLTFPAKFLFTLATVIAVNAFFLWVTYEISLLMDPDIVAFKVVGGVMGWLVVSVILGLANWVMKHVL